MNYKETLNLLETPFSMRANAKHRESELQEYWREIGLYEQLSSENSGPSFTIHDGPPYANGSLHIGHALNKILKDIINKHALLNGYRAKFTPGWDCHGLPIELKVLQSLSQEERKKLTPLELRKRAGSYALDQVNLQRQSFKRWGIWGEWDNPYLTLNKKYEASQIEIFGKMALSGHIYRGLKPVHWSPSSRTALAEAELEYKDDHISSSIYVAFPVVDLPERLKTTFECNQLSLVIWTTTPWTIPANQAISLNETLDYSICEDAHSESSELLIVATNLIEKLSETFGIALRPIMSLKGSELLGTKYRHPLFERICPVVSGNYVTTDTGTGLVHTAPGHGIDDFNTGISNDLEILCIVNESGILTEDAEKFAGLNIFKDANPEIIISLKDSGVLLAEESYVHSYPYDWRTKKPVIFRATEQWFASVNNFRETALNEISKVKWLPEISQNRIESMIRDRGDWCISRQRTWGVPIPVFYHRHTDEILLDEESLKHIQALIAEKGSDVWWELSESELLPPSRSHESDQWIKGTDTMDVWFDSGTSWAQLEKPADICLEGSDQHRGWFQSSLLTSVAVNETAPYKKVLTHGFVLDKTKMKMSKSQGNVIDPNILVDGGKNEKIEPPYGADVLRLWVSSVNYSNDVSIGDSIIKQVVDVYRKVRNTARYLLGNLYDFNPATDCIAINELPLLDLWMLQRQSEFLKRVTAHFENHEFYKFYQELQNFCNVDLSNIYLDIAKDRLYVSGSNDFRRRSCQTVLQSLIENLSVVISPVLCHMAEDIWQNLPYNVSEKSVFERGWPKVIDDFDTPYNTQIEEILFKFRPLINNALEASRNSGMGPSLEAEAHIYTTNSSYFELFDMSNHSEVDNLKDWLQVSSIKINDSIPENVLGEASSPEHGIRVLITHAPGEKCDRCWHYETIITKHDTNGKLCNRCLNTIEK